jgi:type IV pilus assembly protein PilM
MSFLSNILGTSSSKKNKSVLGLDIGSSSLKVVQLRKENGGAVLETYGELALGPYGGVEVGQATNLPADKIGETLIDLLREAKVTTTSAGVSIPFSRSLLTLVELPRAKTPDEQKTIVELEARKYIPVPVTEVQLDWFIIPDPPSQKKPAPKGADKIVIPSKVRVLIVAVHNDELSLLQNVTKAAGLQTDFYEIEIFSTIRSVVDEPVKPVMVLDIGASATKVYIVEHGVVALSHTIPQGGQDVTRTISSAHNMSIADAETLKKQHGFTVPAASYTKETIELVFSRIFEEAKRVFTQYETNNHKSISCIVLTGGGGVTKELGTYARQFFSIDVKVSDPFGKTQAPAFMRPVLQEIGPEFAVAVGLALRKLEELP